MCISENMMLTSTVWDEFMTGRAEALYSRRSSASNRSSSDIERSGLCNGSGTRYLPKLDLRIQKERTVKWKLYLHRELGEVELQTA